MRVKVTFLNRVITTNSGRKELKTWIKDQQHIRIWSTDWYDFYTGRIIGNCINKALDENMVKLYVLYKNGEFNGEDKEITVTLEE